MELLAYPMALELIRDANFLASLSLYGMCGLVWLYRGNLRELVAEAWGVLERMGAKP